MEIEPNLNTSQTQDLQNQLKSFEIKYASAHKMNLVGLGLILIGGGLCADGELVKVGVLSLIAGLVLFIYGNMRAGTYASKIKMIRKKLSEIDPSQFAPMRNSIGKTIANVILILFTIAVIGIGGCFAVFGLMSMGDL